LCPTSEERINVKRTHIIATAAAVGLLPAGAALASTPPGSAPPAGSGSAAPATIYNDDRNPVATVTVGSTEVGWTGYGEDDAPDEGNEYLRMTVTVTNAGEDEFSVSVGDFILQDGHGRIDGGDGVESQEEAAGDTDPTTEADLQASESVDLTITFQYNAAAGPQSVFYRQGEDWLVDIAEVGMSAPADGGAAPAGTEMAPAPATDMAAPASEPPAGSEMAPAGTDAPAAPATTSAG
jgi:hypothetical protein